VISIVEAERRHAAHLRLMSSGARLDGRSVALVTAVSYVPFERAPGGSASGVTLRDREGDGSPP